MKTDIKSMLPQELKDYFEAAGEKAFRAEQVFRWLHNPVISNADAPDSADNSIDTPIRRVSPFSSMSNLPVKLREKLDDDFYIKPPAPAGKQVSAIDGTIKYLMRMYDGNAVESIVMAYDYGHTACISSQVGCRMNCTFCASAPGGLVRNLSASEMEDQVSFAQRDTGRRISNVVLMGIGEPLDNFENVLRFLRLISHKSGMNIGARRITLSTCGITENIDKLAEYDIKLTLSVSLHAADDETRSRLMPVNRTIGVDNLIRTCEEYFRITGRRVTYEYAMIRDVNDTRGHAHLLAGKLKRTGSHVNLIPLSSVPGNPMQASSRESINEFAGILKQSNVNYTIRRKLGSDIEASCGQLRRKIDSSGSVDSGLQLQR